MWSDKSLEYYKRKVDLRPLKDPIDLEKCISVIDSPAHDYVQRKNYRNVLCLHTLARNYYFVCDTEEDKNIWRRKICEVREFSGTMTTEGKFINFESAKKVPHNIEVGGMSHFLGTSPDFDRAYFI